MKIIGSSIDVRYLEDKKNFNLEIDKRMKIISQNLNEFKSKEEKLLYIKNEKDRYGILKECNNISWLSAGISVITLLTSALASFVNKDDFVEKVIYSFMSCSFGVLIFGVLIPWQRRNTEYALYAQALKYVEIELNDIKDEKDELYYSLEELKNSLDIINDGTNYLKGQMDTLVILHKK
ncbi:hypothetical protein [Clostridium sp. C2-6-12]|uniref:hypothetical protein n=1 Tax=Clostridium sp. C2-6-12 TaxID=2698832 RepID=UPI00136DBB0B|nr:hypothetical protein [Clostridium sp. C2-6-12]